MKTITVVGARPNFIKVAPLVPALRAAGIGAELVHTGQHYDAGMSDVFFDDLDIPTPAWFLGVGSGTHAVQTAAAMVKLEELFAAERPDAVIVVGDVNSTLAGALAASKLRIPVIHLEAGLRSGDMSMPEEINRLVTDTLSALLLAPTDDAVDNLLREGVPATRVALVGNIMAESLRRNEARARERGVAGRLGLTVGEYALATIHRPENTDDPSALREIAAALQGAPLPVLFPVHPRTRPLLEALNVDASGVVRLVEPVGYLDMLSLQADAAVIVTDSGGIQEESCLLRTPCVTVRRNTERQVTVEAGANRLVPAERSAIAAGMREAMASDTGWEMPPLWDDGVSGRVVAALERGVAPLDGC